MGSKAPDFTFHVTLHDETLALQASKTKKNALLFLILDNDLIVCNAAAG